MSERSPKARRDLGHTVQFALKLHPDLKAHVDRMAEEAYCSAPEYVRSLIVADKRKHDTRARLQAEADAAMAAPWPPASHEETP